METPKTRSQDSSVSTTVKEHAASQKKRAEDMQPSRLSRLVNQALRHFGIRGQSPTRTPSDDPAAILREEDYQSHLATNFSRRKKWWALFILSMVQISMNFNASVYGNAMPGLQRQFQVDERTAGIGQWVFLITYAFGCELWAPWSEDYGRVVVLQLSLWMVNAWQILCGASPSMSAVIIGRGEDVS